MSANSTAKVIVIGGGISGLAVCYFLSKRGIRPVLVEKSGRLGGLIQTDHIAGCDLEAGPDSFIAAKTSVAALAHELGISDQIIGSNDQARRIFIRKNGKLLPMPKGMSMMVPGELLPALRSPLFSTATKVRFFRERMLPPRERTGDVSIDEFIGGHFGRGMVDALAEPLLSGVYGGDAAKLSANSVLPSFIEYERQYGSLIQGVVASRKTAREGSLFQSFAGGMQTLTDALTAAIWDHTEVHYTAAQRVIRAPRGWQVELEDETLASENVVLACPAHVAAKLIDNESPALSANLEAIPYSSAVLVMLVYDRTIINHPLNGFGLLIPRSERRHIAAATWVSTKFPSRTPDDRAALRGFIVGDDAERLMLEPEAVLVNIVRDEFRTLMGINAEPLLASVHRWPKSMPQYVVGHQLICNTVAAIVSELPGLHICGNAYSGVGIPDCIRLARQLAADINLT